MCAHVCPWWGGYFIDNRLRRLLHRPDRILAAHVQPGMTVMDFGCGMGFFAIAMARMVGDGGRVIAVDLQEKMLDVLGKRAAMAGVADRIHTQLCPRQSIGVDEPVDFALAFYSVHEVPDPQRLFAELHGILRPRAKLVLVEPIGHVTKRAFDKTLQLAEQTGFRIQDRPRIRLSHAAQLEQPY